MQMIKQLSSFLLFIAIFSLRAFSNDTTGVIHSKDYHQDETGGITVPKGFSATVARDTVGHARHLVVSSNGIIYVKLERLKNGKGIYVLRDNNGDGKIDNVSGFGNYIGTGIAIKNGYLYASSNTS